MFGDDAAAEAHPDTVQVRGHVHETADRRGIDGVIVGIETDAVVAARPDFRSS